MSALLAVAMLAAAHKQPKRPAKPAVVVVCQRGGIVRHGALIVSASGCVARDKYGGSASLGNLRIFGGNQ